MEALRRIAEETTKVVKSAVFETTGFWLEPDLRCELYGKDDTDDLQVEHLNAPVPHRTRLLFLYRCVYRDMKAVVEHSVRCNHVIMQGYVPLPPFWKACLSATVIPQKAAALASELGAEGLLQAEVHVLGAPKNGTPTCGRGFPGALFELSGDVEPRVVLLCARLDEMVWYCHPGSFTGEEVCTDNPFREADLLELNTGSESLQQDPDAARKGALLFDMAQKNQEAFGKVCAYAATRAWLRRARSQSRPAIGCLEDFFEPNPFHWKEAECRGGITQTFLWTWRWADDQVWHFAGRRQIVKNSIAKVRDITMPEPLREYLQKARAKPTEERPQSEEENEELRALRAEAAQLLLDCKDATTIISSIWEKNGDLDTLTATCGRPLLSIACVHAESAPSVELLLAHGADVHTAARDGREPLHYACGRGDAPLFGVCSPSAPTPTVPARWGGRQQMKLSSRLATVSPRMCVASCGRPMCTRTTRTRRNGSPATSKIRTRRHGGLTMRILSSIPFPGAS